MALRKCQPIMTYLNTDKEAQMNPSGAMTLAYVSQTLSIAVLLQMIIISIIKEKPSIISYLYSKSCL